MSTLSVAMIVKNEEQFIEKVIRNVQPVCDEIVITDTGSTDRTVDIIKRFKTRLFHYKWDSDISRARNFCLSKCKTDWILFIDADEFINIRDYQKIRKLMLSKNRFIAYRILLRDYFNPNLSFGNLYKQDWIGGYNFYTIIRIFKNGEGIFYSRPEYETAAESLRGRSDKVGNTDIVFHHLDILRNKQKKSEKKKCYHDDVFKNLKSSADNPEVNYVVAHYYMLNGRFNKAVTYYEKTLRLKPEYVKARLSLGLTYIMLGKENKGMGLIKGCGKDKNVHPWEMESYLNSAYRIIADRISREKS